MTTLISVHNSEGCVGRCDAKCYDAKHPTCICICGGRNHGVGRSVAIGNVTEDMIGARSLEDFARKNGLDPGDLTAALYSQRELSL